MNGTTRFVLCVLLLIGAAGLGCEDDGEIGSPLSVSLTGPGTGLAGDGLPFQYQVEGRSLSGIVFEWGDGARDSLPTAGAQSAEGTRVHTYDSAGVYTVSMVVEDALEGTDAAQVTVDVQSDDPATSR